MARHYGPNRINGNGQVTVPEGVRELPGVGKGDEVFFEVLDDPPGCVLIVPVAIGDTWWSSGKSTATRKGTRSR